MKYIYRIAVLDTNLDTNRKNVYICRWRCGLKRIVERALKGIRARWQNGNAAACKAVYVGSIPILASILSPGGGIGRRYGLKIR